MRIMIGGSEAFSRSYSSFDEFMDEYVDHMDERGRRVPDYDISIVIVLITTMLMEKICEELISRGIGKILEGKEEEEARELEEKRHSELLDKIEDLKREVQDARLTPQETEAALPEDDAAVASALLRWAKKENVRIDIVLETEAEVDLKEAFEALTRDVPGSTTGG